MPTLSIRRPGLFTSVQDLGRWGYQSCGVPVSGAMDSYSHRLANRLVGNRDGDATLEATLIGPEIEFGAQAVFAVTGAAFALTLDARAVETNQRLEARAGSVLKFGARLLGARAYIAVGGGVDVPEVLGSRSTHVLTRMGGLDGRALRAGDGVKTGTRSAGRVATSVVPLGLPQGGARVRVIAGEPTLCAALASERLRVSPRSDRMGYRLEGVALGGAPTGELISMAVSTGTIQIPPTGEPILLMSDHATTGGYVVGATIISADLPLAGQLAPGDWIEFEPCSTKSADRALREQEAALGAA